jgi:hypothetical protein
MKRGLVSCVVCGGNVRDPHKTNIVVFDPSKRPRIDNLRLRHAFCVWNKHRPVHSPVVLERIVEWFITNPDKLCSVCGKTLVNEEYNKLVPIWDRPTHVGPITHIAHLPCV